jgi:hypothetical protein
MRIQPDVENYAFSTTYTIIQTTSSINLNPGFTLLIINANNRATPLNINISYRGDGNKVQFQVVSLISLLSSCTSSECGSLINGLNNSNLPVLI